MAEYGIVANVESDRAFRTGAKVWVFYVYGNGETAKCYGVNKAGRYIEKRLPLKRLTNFRGKWMPEHLRERAYYLMGKDDALSHAATLEKRWQGVRYFGSDGGLLKDGKTPEEAFLT